MKSHARLVIIGGGVMGLSIAYQCARRGLTDIVVLDRSYINGGASGRCGGGIRHQWSTELNVQIMRRSVELFKRFPQELGINIWFRQGGYLFLLTKEEEVALFERNIAIQNACKIPTRLITPKEVKKFLPYLQTDGIVAASYNPSDGVLFPWPVLWGYANAAQRLGVEILPFTEVTALELKGNRIHKIITNRGEIEPGRVINAAGAWAPAIGAMVGIDFPNRPFRHEIVVTESLKAFLDPMIVLFSEGLYFSQSLRGEIIGGISDPEASPSLNYSSSFAFLKRFAKKITALIPLLKEVKVLRQWAGCYDITPDHKPILGEVEEVEDFIQCHGFVGHGFMMAPAISENMADFLISGKTSKVLDSYSFQRFKRDMLEKELCIIG